MTPVDIIESARLVLGQIDLDPASSAYANDVILARRYIEKSENGLTAKWYEDGEKISVYLNPPGGKLSNRSLCAAFWQKLMEVFDSGNLIHAIFMAFSCEALQTTQNLKCRPILDFPFCVPRRRIKFVHPSKIKTQPSHSNVIVYVPGEVDRTVEFYKEFSQYGYVMK